MDFAAAMNEWIGLKSQLAAARRDISILNNREKELKKYVTVHMTQNDIDTVKVRDTIKVNLKKKKSKGGITKDVIRVGLSNYFNQDAARVDGAMQAIVDAQPMKEVSSVSVTGLKTAV